MTIITIYDNNTRALLYSAHVRHAMTLLAIQHYLGHSPAAKFMSRFGISSTHVNPCTPGCRMVNLDYYLSRGR